MKIYQLDVRLVHDSPLKGGEDLWEQSKTAIYQAENDYAAALAAIRHAERLFRHGGCPTGAPTRVSDKPKYHYVSAIYVRTYRIRPITQEGLVETTPDEVVFDWRRYPGLLVPKNVHSDITQALADLTHLYVI